MAFPKFTPRSYYSAAQEHLGIAGQMLRQSQPQYYVAHYFAGLAVEDILRALSVKEGDTFDSSHSIEHLAKKAALLPQGSQEKQDALRAALDEINIRWRANQRYYTAKMLDAYLEATRLDKIRGDRVKYSSKHLFELAALVVGVGVETWQSNNKSKTS